MLRRETRAGKLEAPLAGGADCGRMTGKHFVSNQRPMSPERPVWVRSRVGGFTTAYRRGPEVRFEEGCCYGALLSPDLPEASFGPTSCCQTTDPQSLIDFSGVFFS